MRGVAVMAMALLLSGCGQALHDLSKSLPVLSDQRCESFQCMSGSNSTREQEAEEIIRKEKIRVEKLRAEQQMKQMQSPSPYPAQTQAPQPAVPASDGWVYPTQQAAPEEEEESSWW